MEQEREIIGNGNGNGEINLFLLKEKLRETLVLNSLFGDYVGPREFLDAYKRVREDIRRNYSK